MTLLLSSRIQGVLYKQFRMNQLATLWLLYCDNSYFGFICGRRWFDFVGSHSHPMSTSPETKQLTKQAFQATAIRTFFRSYLPQNIRKGCIPTTYYYSYIRRWFTTCWQECWSEDTRGSKLLSVKLSVRPRQSSCRLSRYRQVTLNRLRIEHTNLTYS